MTEPPAPQEQQMRVLVCEDNLVDFWLIRQYLQSVDSWSVSIDLATTADEARALLADRRHDVALVDYSLPGGNGLDLLCDAIAMDWPGPTIMLTGNADPAIDHAAAKLGAADFLSKDALNAPALERSIRYSRERKRLEQLSADTHNDMLQYIRQLQDAMRRIDEQNQRIVSLAYHLAGNGRDETSPSAADTDGAALGIWTLSADGRARDADSVVLDLFETPSLGDLLDRSVDVLLAPASRLRLWRALAAASERNAVSVEVELVGQASGRHSWAVLSLLKCERPDGAVYVATVVDITSRRNNENANRYLARHDSLTGLANRTQFGERFDHASAIAQRNGTLVGLVCLDLDKFKPINDGFGHLAGDDLLKQVAKRLERLARASDTVARLGGDEFGIIATNLTSADDAAQLARKVATAFDKPFDVRGRAVRCGASVGVGLYPADGDSLEAVFDVADAALYANKRQRRVT